MIKLGDLSDNRLFKFPKSDSIYLKVGQSNPKRVDVLRLWTMGVDGVMLSGFESPDTEVVHVTSAKMTEI